MNITRKSLLLASAAAAVIGLGFSSSPAKAFDEVNWSWNKFVDETVLKEVNILVDVAPSGMVEVEKIQFMIGNVTATSSITDFTNNPPGDILVVGEPIPIGERIAIDLPAVNSQSTAVGNNQDISSSTSLELHDGQYLIGDISSEVFPLFDAAGNSHTQALNTLVNAAGIGAISPATVSADSSVSSILNSTINSEATAVANNMNIELAAFTPDDATMIGDVTQFAYTDVNANSLVHCLTVEGYSDMGAAGLGPNGLGVDQPQIPVINSVATAVGNNFSLRVSSPEL